MSPSRRAPALLHPLEPLDGAVQLPIVAGLIANQLVHRPAGGQRSGAKLGLEIQLLVGARVHEQAVSIPRSGGPRRARLR